MNNQLQYEDIREKLTAGCKNAVVFPAGYDAKMYKTRGNAAFLDRATDFLAVNKGEMEKNLQTMVEAISDYDIAGEGTSLISRTYKGICTSFVSKLDFGPFFAKRMLYGGNNENLIHAVDGYIAKNNENLAHELRQSDLRNEEYEEAKLKMDTAIFLNEKPRMENYLNALNNLYVHHYKVEQYQRMNELLEAYKKHLLKLNHEFFAVLIEVLETLRDTFAKNAQVLFEGTLYENSNTWKILSVKDIQAGLDAEVKKLDLDQTLYALMTNMLTNCQKWITRDENEISKLISGFILNQFHRETMKTMTDYLKERFKVENTTLLVKAIEENIIQDILWRKSTPLFWQNPMYNNPTGERNTLTVPYDSYEIVNAANNFATDYNKMLTVRRIGSIDKLSITRCYNGFALYAYQGLQELQNAYEEYVRPGRHLYESGGVNWNTLLPSPIPASFEVDIPIPRIQKRNKKLITEFERAKELGVVTKNSLGIWEIQKTEEFDLDMFLKEASAGNDLESLAASDLKKMVEKLEEKAQDMKINTVSERIQSQRSKYGCEEIVMLDFYLKAPILNKIVSDELAKRTLLEDKIASLKELVQSSISERK